MLYIYLAITEMCQCHYDHMLLVKIYHQKRSFKWGYLKMQIFRNFAFRTPENAQDQIIPNISILVVPKIKEHG